MEHKGYSPELDMILTIATEKKPDEGEDSYATASGRRAGLIACLDGLGGAGAKRYDAANFRTGAYVASRVCGASLSRWFEANGFSERGLGRATSDDLSADIKATLLENLTNAQEMLGVSGSGLRGSLSKPLPTTLAAALYEVLGDRVRCVFLWAGDSRAYLFTTLGLRQMTADDVQGGKDALDNLKADGAITNVITPAGDFTIHALETTVGAPCMLLTATDGCFGYFASPVEFEGMLLETLMASANPAQWKALISKRLEEVSGDDCTMHIALFGMPGFDDIRRAYARRAADFDARYAQPLKGMIRQGDTAGMAALWDQYRKFYLYGTDTDGR